MLPQGVAAHNHFRAKSCRIIYVPTNLGYGIGVDRWTQIDVRLKAVAYAQTPDPFSQARCKLLADARL